MVLMFVTILVLIVLVLKVKKRLSPVQMYVTSIFSVYLALFADSVLGGMYELYSYFKPGVQGIDFVGAIVIYPAINILFLSKFPVGKSFRSKTFYLIGWSLFAIGYEYIASEYSSFFNYSGWQLIYSVPIYPALYLILVWNLRLVEKLEMKDERLFHLKPIEWYGSIVFILYLNLAADAILKGSYELYYYVVNDVHPVDFVFRMLVLLVPLLFYLSTQSKQFSLWKFILWIVIYVVIYEIADQLGYFHEKQWNSYLTILKTAATLILVQMNLRYLQSLAGREEELR
ncbi:CBO0543 family protein [Bacillus sp. Marseille-Q1617]|uniref:CBO0543 family protein n=1 Tax=Bacillus sp. Marseille-Q1617 TaxID=2736887 RepID=UPI0015887FC8|nr:CBO0543 family protein [Bacillus sp. Marseille-Q1617]